MSEYKNEVLKAIHERRSIRSFKAEAPTDEEIEAVVEAGLCSASAMNMQPTKIIVIKDAATRKRFTEVNAEIMGKPGADTFYGAPVILLVVAEAKGKNAMRDGSLVLGDMMLAAHSLGLGSCWINRAEEELEMEEFKAFLKELGIEEDCVGVGHLSLGYIEGEMPKAPHRRAGRVFHV